MRKWKELAHFVYGQGFWYADPVGEVEGLSEEDLFWTQDPNGMCILWHIGHIAHRERIHIGVFLQGLGPSIIPAGFDVFGPEWHSTEEVRQSIGSVQEVFDWVREVRSKSREYIDSVTEEDLQAVPQKSHGGLPASHWLFLTPVHGGVHIGRIQMMRAQLEGKRDRAC